MAAKKTSKKDEGATSEATKPKVSTEATKPTRSTKAAKPAKPAEPAEPAGTAKPAEAPRAAKASKSESGPFDDAALGAGWDDALAVVARTPVARQEELVKAWLARPNAAAIAAVAARDDAPSAARKAARRAVSVLKSRGVPIPDRPSVATLVQRASYTYEARCLFPDTHGARIWWIAKVASTGGTDVVEVTTIDRRGLVNLQRGNPTSGNLRNLWDSWVQRVGRRPVAVPVDWARQCIAEARKLAESMKAVLPMGLDAARELLEPPEKPVPHPIEGQDLALPAEEAAVKARLDGSMRLHEEPELGPWLPEDPAAVSFLEAINERVSRLENKEQAAIDAIIEELVAEAADAYFNEERKPLYARRLRDAAWSLLQAERVQQAIDALLLGQAIERAGVISDRPSEIPFVRGMFVKLIAVAQAQAQQAAAG